MANEAVEILCLNGNQRTSPEYSQPFRVIMRKWKRTTIELNAVFEEERMKGTGRQAQCDIEAKYEKAGRDQRDVLESLAMLSANKVDDVLAKLELWKATACPTLETEESLSLTEQLLLSAYYDLKQISTLG